jgi:hypothetical protein
VASILDKRFYEKVVVIANNARLIADKTPSLDIDMDSIHGDAVESFFQKRYTATVFFASIGVERYLNKALKEKEWIFLKPQSIKDAYRSGILAVTELLDKSEKTVLTKGRPYPIFCGRRNKVLHGDIEGLVKIKGPEIGLVDTPTIRMEKGISKKAYAYMIDYLESAYDQLLKFQKFLLKT